MAGGGAALRQEGFLSHAGYRWLWLALVLAGVAALLYRHASPPDASGGTAIGYILGGIATGLVLWLTALGIRKRRPTPGHWTLKGWTSAHVYLGLAAVVVATLHTGFEFGWNVHTLAWALLLLVAASGVLGVVLYKRVPARMSANRGAATQVAMLATIAALDGQIAAAAQPLGAGLAEAARLSLARTRVAGGAFERLTGWRPGCATAWARRHVAEVGGPDAAPLAELLDRKAAALAQTRRHIRYKAWLEAWLWLHVPASVALLAALAVHIVSVFFYW